MSNNTKKTIHHTKLELLRSLKQPFEVDTYSTLNEFFSVGDINPPATGYPALQYIAIGRGGHEYVAAAGNNTVVQILEHSVTDAVLFDFVPFITVPVTNDLTGVEQQKYGLRVLEQYNGVDYFSYYLKAIDNLTSSPITTIIELDNGKVISEIPYVPASTSLNPSPVDISNTIVNTVQGKHVVVKSTVTIDITPEEITTILDAVEIKFGDRRLNLISEIGLVSGFPYTYTSNDGGLSVSYTEVRSAQIQTFIGMELPLQEGVVGATINVGISDTMPLPPVII